MATTSYEHLLRETLKKTSYFILNKPLSFDTCVQSLYELKLSNTRFEYMTNYDIDELESAVKLKMFKEL